MKKRFIIWLCLGFLVALLYVGLAEAKGIQIVIDGNRVTIPHEDQQAIIRDDRVFVPLRVIAENLGAEVEWFSETKQVVISTLAKNIKPVPRNNYQNAVEIVINERVIEPPAGYGNPFITDKGRVLVPLRLIGENLECQVEWIEDSRTVEIFHKNKDFYPVPGPSPSPDPNADPEVANLINELASYQTNIRLSDMSFINSKELLTKDINSFSAAEINHLKQLLNLLKRYDKNIQLPNGQVIASADLTIKGAPLVTAEQLNDWLRKETPRIRAKMQEMGREFIPIPDYLAELYIEIGKEYGIRGDLAFCQAVKETHYFQFTGDVKPYQNNFCGLWATGSPCSGAEPLNGVDPSKAWFEKGVHGLVFASPEIGVEAHIQHLYAYSTPKDIPLPANKELCNPRYVLVNRGSATTWQGLNARWAVPGTTYGQSIIQDYWMNSYR
ncbi:stalk domain-containing protein [Desulfofalx alkaliphila]|uniref:stalk domain-containing protein n=1 Tax=Desulfofalx alkaliphila TaxID=105483 RepID=UPI0004E1F683|nr:stalk domain-containing protein [Desulfofalx alkaliphila]